MQVVSKPQMILLLMILALSRQRSAKVNGRELQKSGKTETIVRIQQNKNRACAQNQIKTELRNRKFWNRRPLPRTRSKLNKRTWQRVNDVCASITETTKILNLPAFFKICFEKLHSTTYLVLFTWCLTAHQFRKAISVKNRSRCTKNWSR